MIPKPLISAYQKIVSALQRLFSSKTLKRIDDVSDQIRDVLVFALPAVEYLAKLTPNTMDDRVVVIIKELMLDTPIPQDGKFDEATRQGVLMYAAGLLARNNVSDALKKAGADGIRIGGQLVKDQSEIPDSVINAATNILYGVLKNAK